MKSGFAGRCSADETLTVVSQPIASLALLLALLVELPVADGAELHRPVVEQSWPVLLDHGPSHIHATCIDLGNFNIEECSAM